MSEFFLALFPWVPAFAEYVYAAIPMYINAYLLSTMAAIVTIGYIWRAAMGIQGYNTSVYKYVSGIAFGLLSIFYLGVALDWFTYVQSIAVIRIVWLMILLNETVNHVYIAYTLRRYYPQI